MWSCEVMTSYLHVLIYLAACHHYCVLGTASEFTCYKCTSFVPKKDITLIGNVASRMSRLTKRHKSGKCQKNIARAKSVTCGGRCVSSVFEATFSDPQDHVAIVDVTVRGCMPKRTTGDDCFDLSAEEVVVRFLKAMQLGQTKQTRGTVEVTGRGCLCAGDRCNQKHPPSKTAPKIQQRTVSNGVNTTKPIVMGGGKRAEEAAKAESEIVDDKENAGENVDDKENAGEKTTVSELSAEKDSNGASCFVLHRAMITCLVILATSFRQSAHAWDPITSEGK